MYDQICDDWFMDIFLTPSITAFARECVPILDPVTSTDDLDSRRSRPSCMKKWIEYDTKMNPTTSGSRINELKQRFQIIANQFEKNNNLSLSQRCNILPNSVYLPYKIDIHFPIFSEHFTEFFSLSLLAYDVLGQYYRQCGYSLEHLLFEEKMSWQFWRAPPVKHEWVTDLVHIIENKWKTQIIAPITCAALSRSVINAQTEKFDNLIAAASSSNSYDKLISEYDSKSIEVSENKHKERGPYRVPTNGGWMRHDRKWFHHASDALYLSSLVLREDPCKYQGAVHKLLNQPLSFLILNRKNDRKIVNIHQIVTTINSISEISADGSMISSQPQSDHKMSNQPFRNYPKLHGMINSDTKSEHSNVFLFEGASLETQARILSNTDIIIVPHGAAETNLAWLKPCSIVLEVFSWAFYDACYVGLCAAVGLIHFQWQEPEAHTVQTNSLIGAITVCKSQVKDTASRIAKNWNQYQSRQPSRLIPSSGNQSLFDSFVTEECMRDGDCRTCSRGALEVTVSIPYLTNILKQALVDRQTCVSTHPFYTDTK